MTQLNKSQKKNYTQVSNIVLNDKDLSLKAKGLFAFMDSKPNGWNFTYRSMSKQLKEGEISIRSALVELKEKGYLEYTKHSTGHGEYTIFDNPCDGNPREQNPKKVKPSRISNTKPLVKKINSYELFIEELKEQASIPSKVTITKKGKEFFSQIENVDKLKIDYVAYQADKKEFAKRITDYMEDYQTTAQPEQHYSERLGYIV